MARNKNNAQIFDSLSSVSILRKKATTPADTTVATAFAADAATFDVASATNISAADLLRVGAGSEAELVKVSSIASVTVTPVHTPEFAHDALEDVVEMEATDLGPPGDDGVETDAEGDFSPIFAGTRRMVMAYRGGHYAPLLRFTLLEQALENWCVAHGMAESLIKGSGTSAVPHQLALNPASFATELNNMFRFAGVMHNTTTNIQVTVWGAEIDWTKAMRQTFRRTGGETLIPIEIRCVSAIEIQTWT